MASMPTAEAQCSIDATVTSLAVDHGG